MPLNQAWKRLVVKRLDENLKSGRSPGTRAELARMVGADKAGLNRALAGDQASYKFAKQICDILGIESAMVDNPRIDTEPVEPDEWARTVADVRTLPDVEQRRILRMVQAALRDDDSSDNHR